MPSKGIYGGATTAKPIYGVARTCKPVVIECLPNFDLTKAFADLAGTLETVIKDMFPTSLTRAPFISKMTAEVSISPPIAVRFLWRSRYAPEKWIASRAQILQLYDIYLENNWPTDGDRLMRNIDELLKGPPAVTV